MRGKLLIDRRKIDNRLVALADSIDDKELAAYIEHINGVNSMPNDDVRFMVRYRDAAIATQVIKRELSTEGSMPTVMGRESASVVETLRWLNAGKDADITDFGALTSYAKELSNAHGLGRADHIDSDPSTQVYNTIMAVDKAAEPVSRKLEKMAELAAQIPASITDIRVGRRV